MKFLTICGFLFLIVSAVVVADEEDSTGERVRRSPQFGYGRYGGYGGGGFGRGGFGGGYGGYGGGFGRGRGFYG